MDSIDILVVLDRSGSMATAKNDHEGGLKSFVEDQRSLPGDVRFTLVQFDTANPCEVIYDRAKIEDVTEIKLIPRGGTPLLDAVGKSIAHLEAALDKAKAKPDQTVVMIITDGEENESREWNRTQLAARVKDLEAKGWTFLFLGANMDAFDEAGNLGFQAGRTMTYTSGPSASTGATGAEGPVGATYANLAGNMLRSRGMVASANAAGTAFDWNEVQEAYVFTSAQRTEAIDGLATAGSAVSGSVSGSATSTSSSSPATTVTVNPADLSQKAEN
jgi:uncharacterized protein YegL